MLNPLSHAECDYVRGTHPDRVSRTDNFFFQALLGVFSCVLSFSSLLRWSFLIVREISFLARQQPKGR